MVIGTKKEEKKQKMKKTEKRNNKCEECDEDCGEEICTCGCHDEGADNEGLLEEQEEGIKRKVENKDGGVEEKEWWGKYERYYGRKFLD